MFTSGRLTSAVACVGLTFLLLQAAGSLLFADTPVKPTEGNLTLVTNILQLRQAANRDHGSLVAYCLQGTVLGKNSELGLVVFQDESGTELLQIHLAGRLLSSGQQILLQGTNFVAPPAFGVDIERSPIVNNDGLHSKFERSGSVYLRKGSFPIRVLWFNSTSPKSLDVEYSGPNFARRKIPHSALLRSLSVSPGGNDTKGLDYRCYEDPLQSLASLQSLVPVKTGVTSNFDLTITTRDERVALAFDGRIQIETDGIYTFYLSSHDGSQLFIKNTPSQLTLMGVGSNSVVKKIVARQPLSDAVGQIWAEVDGTVTFVGGDENGIEMELTSSGSHMRIIVCDTSAKSPRYLLGSLVRLRGLCLDRSDTEGHRAADTLVVPDWENVQVLSVNSIFWSSTKSMTVRDCKLLNEQNTPDFLRIAGKLSYPTDGQPPVLEDDTGSVSVELLNVPFARPTTEVECLGRWRRSGTTNVLRAAIWRELPKSLEGQTGLPILTTAAQVQQLTRAEAGRKYPVKIRGVVTFVSPFQHAIAIQDSTRGVSIVPPPRWTGSPLKVGEKIEIEGISDAGNFAPIVLVNKWEKIGTGVLPDPQHPSYDQLIRGSMTSQYVEIRGYVTEARDHHLILLMQGGKIDVEFGPNPVDALDSFVNAVVRIRGCMFAKWDASTLLVTPAHPLWFGNSTICEDIPPPKDVFDAQKMRARELLQFDALGNFFQRVKVSGQILAGDEKRYYCTDVDFGFRFELAKPEKLNPGDDVEVVGLVDLGSASPTLREAVIRRTGNSPLPAPQPFTLQKTNVVRDATRVRVDGFLLDEKDNGTERVLQMQSGGKVFWARLHGKDRLTGQWQVGSRLRMTGVFASLEGGESEALATPFELLINSPRDIVVLTQPPWWTLNRLLTAAGILTVGLILAFVWISLLRHQVKRRTVQLKHEIAERQRVEQVRAIEQERARIAQDLHDDLGSRVTAISMLATVGAEKNLEPAVSKEQFSLILDRSRLLVGALDGLVWAANPKYDTVAALVEYLAGFTEELLTETRIARRIEIPANLPERSIPAETRHNVLLSVKEILNNAIRHGRPSEVLLQIITSSDELEILIRDNGGGFDLAQHIPGEGLANLQRRVGKISGRCRIESEPGKGTGVFLTFPF